MAFGKVFGGVLGGAAAIGTLVVLPIVAVVNGFNNAFEDNPQGKDDVLTTEYHGHNLKQFGEGVTFGIYDADDGLTAESVADTVYDGGKATVESGGKFLERITERLQDDFSDTNILPRDSSDGADKDYCKDPKKIDAGCLEELPEPPEF
ncbi:MAG: hypothetical protein ACRBCK_09265 [Alphaproteobacteria bacterium]